MTEPLPCPFCGSTKIDWVHVEETGEGYHLCSGCSARGPACFHCPEGLVDGYWNRRSVTMSDVEQMAERLSDDHFVRLVAGLCHMRCRECGTRTPDGKTCFCNRDE